MAAEEATDRRGCLAEALRPLVDKPDQLIASATPLLPMPAALPGLFVIAENLDAMRQPVRAFASDPAAYEDVWTLAEAITALPSDHVLRSDKSLGGRSERSGSGPLQGFLVRNPIWCALWYRVHGDDPWELEGYRYLQTALLVGYGRLSVQEKTDAYATWLYQAGLLVRELRLHATRPRLHRLSAASAGPASLRDALIEQRDEADADRPARLRDRLGTLARLIEDAFGLDRLTTRRTPVRGTRRRTRPARPHWAETDHEPDHTRYWYAVRGTEYVWGHAAYTVYGRLPDEDDRQEIVGAGGDPGEYGIGENIEIDWYALEDEEPTEPPPPEAAPTRVTSSRRGKEAFPYHLPRLATLYARARAWKRRQEMDSQRMPVDIRRVRRPHIAAIVQTMSDLYAEAVATHQQGATQRNEESRRCQAAIELAAVALVSGTPYVEAAGLTFVDTPEALPEDYKLAYSPRYSIWIRPALGIDRAASAASAAPKSQAMHADIVLPDTWGIGRCLRTDMSTVNSAQLLETWNERVRPRLVEAGVPGKWANLQAISSVLPSHFRALQEGDGLTVALMFGQDDPLAGPQQFYTAHARAELAKRYEDRMTELWQAIRLRQPHAGPQLFEQVHRESWRIAGWTGDDWAPSPERVRPLVQAAADRLRAASDGITPYERHNCLAVYTALGLAIATGYRAVRTPITDLTAIHHETGTLCLQEKDRADGAHARLVVLPDAVLAQVDHYLEHARALYAALPPNKPILLKPRASKHRDQRLADPETGRFTLDLRRTLYFWEKDDEDRGGEWKPVEFTGEGLLRRCHEIASADCWPVANAGRHLLRTELEGHGCPATVINAALGHWSQGEEPWVAASAMDPVHYRQTIRPYVAGLLKRVRYVSVIPPWL